MEKDIFVSNIELLEEYYAHDNFYIRENDCNNTRTLICFSSHATYFPFTEEAFLEKIVKNDHYECKNILNDDYFTSAFGRIIYCRDLYREWYVKGISRENDSIKKVIEFLRELTNGQRVYTMGSSSGGYLATIVGIELDAEAVYSFSGQFSLKRWEHRKYLTYYSQNPERSQYYNIVEKVKKSKVPLFYFCPIKSEPDKEQYDLVKDVSNVFVFSFNSKKHGHTVTRYTYKYIFSKDIEEMKCLSQKLSRMELSDVYFHMRLSSWQGCVELGKQLFRVLKERGKGLRDVV